MWTRHAENLSISLGREHYGRSGKAPGLNLGLRLAHITAFRRKGGALCLLLVTRDVRSGKNKAPFRQSEGTEGSWLLLVVYSGAGHFLTVITAAADGQSAHLAVCGKDNLARHRNLAIFLDRNREGSIVDYFQRSGI